MIGRRIKECRRFLTVLEVVLIIGITVELWRTIGLVSEQGSSPADVPRETPLVATDSDSASTEMKPLDWFAPLWQRDLTQPPIPPVVAKAPEPVPTPSPPPTLPKLLGTFVEGDVGWAHVVSAEGKIRVVRTHDRIDSFAVVAVEPGKALLQYPSGEYWIKTPQRKPVISERP